MAVPYEIKLMQQIAARLKQWTQKHPDTKRIKPLDFHNVCYGLKVELESATDGLNDTLFCLRENDKTGKAEAIEKLYGRLLHGVSAEYHRRPDGLAPMCLELDYAKKAASILVKELQSIKPAKAGQRDRDVGDIYNIIDSHVSLGDKAQHAGRDINTITPKPEKGKGGWGLVKKISLILGIIVSLIVIVGAYNKYYRKGKPAVEQIKTPKTETKQITENKLDLSLKNIC